MGGSRETERGARLDVSAAAPPPSEWKLARFGKVGPRVFQKPAKPDQAKPDQPSQTGQAGAAKPDEKADEKADEKPDQKPDQKPEQKPDQPQTEAEVTDGSDLSPW